MKRLLMRLDNTWSRIVLALVILASGLLFTLGYLSEQFKSTMQVSRQQEMRRITEVARASIEPVIDQYRNGRISHAQALENTRQLIRPMTFSDLSGPNYIFMSTYDGIMLVQPYEPALEGTNQLGLTDARGFHIIKSLIAKAREGSGFITYYYHSPTSSEIQRKISYVIGIPELDAYIGTGMFSQDTENTYLQFQNQMYFVCLFAFVLIFLAQYLLLSPMFSSYRQLLLAFKRTARNLEQRLPLDTSAYRSGSEAEQLLSGFNDMLTELQQKSDERNVAEQLLQQAHAELTAHHEELQASNEELSALYEQVASTSDALELQYNELKTSEALLERSEERYRLALEGAKDVMFDWDLRSGHLIWSARCSEVLGISSSDLSSNITAWKNRIHPDDRCSRDELLKAHLRGETPYYSAEFRVLAKNGQYIWVVSNGKALFNQQGRAVRMAGSFTDITENKLREQQIWSLAYQDALTGLPNRALLTERLNGEFSSTNCGTIFFLDIDNFKLINDSCGHAQGDRLLIETAGRLRAAAGPTSTIARLGGDEFIILMPGLVDEVDISEQAQKLLQALPKQYSMCGHNFFLTVSIGVARYPQDGDTVDELLQNADTALYEVKKSGRNGWKQYDSRMRDQLFRKLNLEQDLQQALEKKQFLLHLQPIYSLASKQIFGYEALLRWNSPEGMIPPLSFIPMAEETGLIIPIGRWVLRDSCRIVRMLREQGYPNLYIAVNISVRQLSQDDFVSMVGQLLADAEIPPSSLVLEITETLLMESFEATVKKLHQLKAMGVGLSLDDFGTGYSSLTYLSKLPIDTVKIDKSFVDDISSQSSNSTLLSSIIDLARNLGFKVVAEGVETSEQSSVLNDCRCHYIQGYLMSRPLPVQQALRLLEEAGEKPSSKNED